MTSWLLSILGVGVLDILVLHFTESTRLHKTIKTVCSVIFILVVIYPIPGLISGTFEFDTFSFSYSTETDSTLIDIVENSQTRLIEKAAEDQMKKDGYIVKITITAVYDNSEIKILKVIAECEFDDKVIKSKISEYLNVGEEYIYIDVKS